MTLMEVLTKDVQQEVVVAEAAGGFLFFGETFTLGEVAGAALTMIATWQVIRSPQTHPTPNPKLKTDP